MSAPAALITGATSGIGRSVACQLGERGYRVAVTGRRIARLHETAHAVRAAGAVDVLELAGSVSERTEVRAHADALDTAFGTVDLAILNAGIAQEDDGRRPDPDAYRRVFETNVFGVVEWLAVLLPPMVARGAGTVAVVSSPGGWRGVPGSGPYSASKAAASTLVESIRQDLRGTGVRIINVCPGFVRSEMTAHQDPKDMPGLLETDDGARRLLDGVLAGRRQVHFPKRVTMPYKLFCRLAPGVLFDRAMARLVPREADAERERES